MGTGFALRRAAKNDYTKRGDLEVLDWDLPSAANDFAYSFAYNGAGQTTMAGYADETLMWTPTAASIGTTDAYGVNGLNQYTSVGTNTTSPQYDGNGNLTTDYRDYDYFYSAENVLRVARDEANNNIGIYYVHGDGTRRLKDAGGVSSNFYYWGDQEVLETETVTQGTALDIASHPVRRRYIRLPGAIDEVILMLSYVDEGATDCSNGCQTWAHHNRLGSVAKTTGFNGTVVKDSFRYSPYGESGTEGDLGFPFRFTGQKLDPETGLYYYKARYYSTETGRFLQTDPIGYEDQMNLYAYVGNDPVNGTDPTGKATYTLGGDIDVFYFLGGGFSLGLYVNPGREPGESLDFGVYGEARFGSGIDASASVEVGRTGGAAENLNGFAANLEVGAGPVSISGALLEGGAASLAVEAGPGITLFNGGGGAGRKFGYQDIISLFSNDENRKANDSGDAASSSEQDNTSNETKNKRKSQTGGSFGDFIVGRSCQGRICK